MSEIFPLAGKRLWVAGHAGMVGSALVRRLAREDCEILTVPRAELDLSRQQPVEDWLSAHKPELVFLAAARVGGILANSTRPGEFLYENLTLQTHVIEAARRAGVAKLVFLGSSCIYPRLAEQPITEEALLTGPLEPTNEWYAIAKIAGLKLTAAYRRQYACDFISVMPTNLYGPNDNFDLHSSHVLPALIRRFHDAKLAKAAEVTIWGTGAPRREFLHVDDCADALIYLAKHYSGEQHINVGAGKDIPILALAQMVAGIVGYQGTLRTDPTKPDGMPRKLLDTTRLNAMGWRPAIGLHDGIASTYDWFLHAEGYRGAGKSPT